MSDPTTNPTHKLRSIKNEKKRKNQNCTQRPNKRQKLEKEFSSSLTKLFKKVFKTFELEIKAPNQKKQTTNSLDQKNSLKDLNQAFATAVKHFKETVNLEVEPQPQEVVTLAEEILKLQNCLEEQENQVREVSESLNKLKSDITFEESKAARKQLKIQSFSEENQNLLETISLLGEQNSNFLVENQNIELENEKFETDNFLLHEDSEILVREIEEQRRISSTLEKENAELEEKIMDLHHQCITISNQETNSLEDDEVEDNKVEEGMESVEDQVEDSAEVSSEDFGAYHDELNKNRLLRDQYERLINLHIKVYLAFKLKEQVEVEQ